MGKFTNTKDYLEEQRQYFQHWPQISGLIMKKVCPYSTRMQTVGRNAWTSRWVGIFRQMFDYFLIAGYLCLQAVLLILLWTKCCTICSICMLSFSDIRYVLNSNQLRRSLDEHTYVPSMKRLQFYLERFPSICREVKMSKESGRNSLLASFHRNHLR